MSFRKGTRDELIARMVQAAKDGDEEEVAALARVLDISSSAGAAGGREGAIQRDLRRVRDGVSRWIGLPLREALVAARRRSYVVLPLLVVAPAVTVAVSLGEPRLYAASSQLAFSGRNTGSKAGDAAQALAAIRSEPILIERTLRRVQAPRESVASLRRELAGSHVSGPRLVVTVQGKNAFLVRGLAGVYAHVLARDQLTRVASDVSAAQQIRPRPVRNGLIALAVAIPLAALIVALIEARGRRRGAGAARRGTGARPAGAAGSP